MTVALKKKEDFQQNPAVTAVSAPSLVAVETEPKAFWYVVKTNFHQERRAHGFLKRGGFNAYLPIRIGKWNRRGERQYHPLFPGYLFVELPRDAERFHDLMTTEGVKSLVSDGGHACRVRQGVVEDIKAREINGLIIIKPKSAKKAEPVCRFKAGDRVAVKFPEKLTDKGLVGGATIEGVFEERVDANRVSILFRLLERDHRVVIPLEGL